MDHPAPTAQPSHDPGAAPATQHSTVYRWPRARLVRPLGFLVCLLGVLWLAAVVVVALTDWSTTTAYAVMGMLTLVALAFAAVVMLRPPAVLELSDQGYRLHNLRGGGQLAASWSEVSRVSTRPSTAGALLVFEGRDNARSVVPLALLGAQTEDAMRQIHTLLDASAGPGRR